MFRRTLIYPLVALLGGGLAVLLVGWPSLSYPLGRDNGIFAYTGWVLLQGQIPYVDFWEHKTPAIFFIYAAMERIFGVSEAGIRRGDLAYSLLVLPFLYLLVRDLFGRRAAMFATLCWAIFHTAVNTLYFWSGAESETFIVLPTILTFYCYLRAMPINTEGRDKARPYSWLWLIAAGFFAGLAIMVKVTAVVVLAALAIYALIFTLRVVGSWRVRLISLLKQAGLVLAGVALAIAPFVVYFAANNALQEAIDVSIIANFFYGQGGSDLADAAWNALGRAGDNLLHLRIYYLLPAIALIYIALRERTRATTLVALWLLFAFAMTWVQGRLWPYHYIGTLVPLSILSGFAVDRILDYRFKRDYRFGRVFQPVVIGLLLVVLTIWSLAPRNGTETYYSWGRYLEYASGQITLRQYRADFHRGGFDYLPNADAASYIAERTQPGDHVLVWAVDPLVNFLAGRITPGRFIYNYPLVSPDIPPAVRANYQRIFMQELAAHPPAIIAVALGDESPITTDSLELLAEFPAFGDYLTANYTDRPLQIAVSPNKAQTFLIYERKLPSPDLSLEGRGAKQPLSSNMQRFCKIGLNWLKIRAGWLVL